MANDNAPRTTHALPAAEPFALDTLLQMPPQGIASRVLGKTPGGNLTLFAFDEGQAISEHTAPFDAFVLVQSGALLLTIGGAAVRATPGSVVRMPAHVPHALSAPVATHMLLVMLRDPV